MIPPDVPPAEAAPPPPPGCPRCLAPMKPGARFCPACGLPLVPGAVPARRPDALAAIRAAERSTLPITRTIVFFAAWLGVGVVSSLAATLGSVTPVILVADVFATAFTMIWVGVVRPSVYKLLATFGQVKWYAIAALAAWPIAFVVAGFVSLLAGLFSLPVIKFHETFARDGFGPVFVYAAVCVQPPLIEELAFRGYLYSALAAAMKPRDAILVTAFAFSIMHFNLAVFVPFVLLGAYLGWLRWKSGSLWAPILAHFLHNLLVTLDEGGVVNLLPG